MYYIRCDVCLALPIVGIPGPAFAASSESAHALLYTTCGVVLLLPGSVHGGHLSFSID